MASTIASSATGVTRKQEKAEGSPLPRGIVGLGSFLFRFSFKVVTTSRIVMVGAVLSFCLTSKRHFFAAPFSMT